MPDQNNPTDTTATPTQVDPPSEPTQMPPIPPAQMDIPAGDASTPPPFPPEVSPPEGTTPPPDSGSAAPSFDIPPVITPNQPSKKFGGKRVIATILGLLVLVGGLGAGVILVRQQQDIREKAFVTECDPGDTASCTINGCPGTQTCGTNYKFGTCKDKPGDNCPQPPPPEPSPGEPPPTVPSYCAFSQRDPTSQGYCDRSAPNTPNCTDVDEGDPCAIRTACGGGTGTCVVISQGGANSECQCQSGAPAPAPTSTKTPIPTEPPGPGPTAQCLDIKAFDSSWTQLTTAQLSSLKVGDIVRFSVGGQASSGSFDRARFKINGVQRPEVTGKRPGTEEYYDEYTIPEGITTFTINAQIHHATLGWSN